MSSEYIQGEIEKKANRIVKNEISIEHVEDGEITEQTEKHILLIINFLFTDPSIRHL